MSKSLINKLIFALIIIVFTSFFAYGFYNAVSKNSEEGAASVINSEETVNPLKIRGSDHVYGNKNAKISLIEYSDFECPFCKRFHLTAKQIVDEFNGEVNWVYRHFPLSFHDPAATREAQASECANELGGNDAFWDYADLIYELTSGNGKGIDKEMLVEMAEEMDLNRDEFEECLDSSKYRDHIRQNFKEGKKLGVQGTPASFIVNHVTGESEFISGAQSFENVKAVINSILNQ